MKPLDEAYMTKAIELAKRGEGWVSPNPLVGAVIVKDGNIIGQGFHRKCGELHAERNALNSCVESPEGACLYVTLTPCCHHGRTPPCTQAILQSGIRRVVIGSQDPNPLVGEKSVALLRAAGITVTEGCLKEQCDRLNPIFFHFITTHTPYVAMKYAMTLDGKTATVTGASQWITGEAARRDVHILRHRYRGIMVGIGTVLQDDPLLTCRLPQKRTPIRIICDSKLRLPLTSQICQTANSVPTIVATATPPCEKTEQLQALGIQVLTLPGQKRQVSLPLLMQELGQQQIDSILLEGGGTLNSSALQQGLVQEIYAYLAPKLFGGTHAMTPVGGMGVSSPQEGYPFTFQGATSMGDDLRLHYFAGKEEKKCLPD